MPSILRKECHSWRVCNTDISGSGPRRYCGRKCFHAIRPTAEECQRSQETKQNTEPSHGGTNLAGIGMPFHLPRRKFLPDFIEQSERANSVPEQVRCLLSEHRLQSTTVSFVRPAAVGRVICIPPPVAAISTIRQGHSGRNIAFVRCWCY